MIKQKLAKHFQKIAYAEILLSWLFQEQHKAIIFVIRVDFNTENLIYPKEIKGRERNDGFDAPENFVVFECVNKLLDKGFKQNAKYF